MVRLIIRQELNGHILSLRLSLIIIITLSLFFLAGLMFSKEMQGRQSDYRTSVDNNHSNFQKEVSSHNNVLAELCRRRYTFYVRPKTTSLITSGAQRDLPNVFYANVYQYIGFDNTAQDNKLLSSLFELDWYLIVSVLMSFFVIIMSYDLVSRERERRSLPFALSYPVSRIRMFLAKYGAIMIVWVTILLVGEFVSVLAVLMSGGGSHLTFDWLARGMLSTVAFTLYLSVFAFLGMLASSALSRPTSSLLLLLFTWIVLIWVIPSMGRILVGVNSSVMTGAKIKKEIELASAQYRLRGRLREIVSENNIEADRKLAEVDDKIRDVYLRARDAELENVLIGKKYTMVSPAVVLNVITETISGTGLYQIKEFLTQMDNYIEQLREFIREKDAQDPESPHFFSRLFRASMISGIEIDPMEVPRFEENQISIVNSMLDSFKLWIVLIGLNFLTGLLSLIGFCACDVRSA